MHSITCAGAFRRFQVVAAVLVAVTTVTLYAQDGAITVKLNRKPDAGPIAPGVVDLWVNGNRLGSVDAGRDVVLKFLPTDSGRYTFRVSHTEWLNGRPLDQTSNPVDIVAGPGATIVATVEIPRVSTIWQIKPSLRLTLIVPSPLRIMSAQLTDKYIEKELSRELVDTPRGAKRTIKRSRTFERFVSVATTSGVESSLKADLTFVAAEIRGKLDRTIGRSVKESETIEQTIEVDGNVLPRVALSWVERRQVGTATATLNGAPTQIPFELAKSLELRVVPVK